MSSRWMHNRAFWSNLNQRCPLISVPMFEDDWDYGYGPC